MDTEKKWKPTHFVEFWIGGGNVCRTGSKFLRKNLQEILENTKKTETIRTVAVLHIGPRKTKKTNDKND